MSVSTHQFQHSVDTSYGYEIAESAEVGYDVVHDIRTGLARRETPAVTFRQEVVADLLTTRGTHAR